MYGKNNLFSHKLTGCNLRTLRCIKNQGSPENSNGEARPASRRQRATTSNSTRLPLASFSFGCLLISGRVWKRRSAGSPPGPVR